MVASSGQDFLLLGAADRPRLESEYTLPLYVKRGSRSSKLLLGSPTGGCKRRRWSCSVFGFVRALRVQSLACPHLYLIRRCVLDATIPTAPPTGFPHSWGHRSVATSGQDFLLLGGVDRPRLESVYTFPLLLLPIRDDLGARRAVMLGPHLRRKKANKVANGSKH